MVTEAQELKPVLVWDEHEILTSQADFLREENPELTEDEAWENASNDVDLIQFEWESFLNQLEDVLAEVNPDSDYWQATVKNFGWQSISGISEPFYVKKSIDFLERVLPKTDCTFRIFIDSEPNGKKFIKIQNFHHDSPTGREWYEVKPYVEQEDEEDVLY